MFWLRTGSTPRSTSASTHPYVHSRPKAQRKVQAVCWQLVLKWNQWCQLRQLVRRLFLIASLFSSLRPPRIGPRPPPGAGNRAGSMSGLSLGGVTISYRTRGRKQNNQNIQEREGNFWISIGGSGKSEVHMRVEGGEPQGSMIMISSLVIVSWKFLTTKSLKNPSFRGKSPCSTNLIYPNSVNLL